MTIQIALLSRLLPAGESPIMQDLPSQLAVKFEDNHHHVSRVGVLSAHDAPKKVAENLTLNFSSQKGVLDFTDVHVFTDDETDPKIVSVLKRLAVKNLELHTDYESIHKSSLDYSTSEDSDDGQWSVDTDDLAYWLENKKLPAKLSSEENVQQQLDDLLGGLFDDDDSEETDEAASDDNAVVEDSDDAQSDHNEEDPSPEETDASARSVAASALIAGADTQSRKATSHRKIDDESSAPAVVAEDNHDADESLVDDNDSDDGDDLFDPNEVSEESSWQRAHDDVFESSGSGAKSELYDPLSDQNDDVHQPAEKSVADSVELSQSDLLDERDIDAVLDETDPFIDQTLDDEESDYGTNNKRAAEPIMEEPGFVKRQREKERRSREVAESLIPDPDDFEEDDDFDELSAEDFLDEDEVDGGLPKEEALSEAQATPRRTRRESAERANDDESSRESKRSVAAARDDDFSGLDDEEEAADSYTEMLMESIENGEELGTVGFEDANFTVHDTYKVLRRERHPKTRVASLTGPSGGSGKTTTSYGCFLSSATVDAAFARGGRREQHTWLIELDLASPKWMRRTSIPADKSLVGVVKDFRRNKGMTDKQIIQCARRHANTLMWSGDEDDEKFANCFVLPAPSADHYTSGEVTKSEVLVVVDRLVRALVLDPETPSTIFLDMPDYEGEHMNQDISDIVNRYSDTVMVCFPDDGDMSDLTATVNLLNQQSQNAVSKQRIAVVGTKMRHGLAQDLQKQCVSMHINYAGFVPSYSDLRRTGNEDNDVQHKTWLANADPKVQFQMVMACALILSETKINPLGERWRDAKLKQLNAGKKSSGGSSRGGTARKQTRNPSSRSSSEKKSGGSSASAKKNSTKKGSSKKASNSKKKSNKSSSGGLKRIFGLS